MDKATAKALLDSMKPEPVKKKKIKSASMVVKDGILYEQVYDPENGSNFLAYDGKNTEFFDIVKDIKPIESDALVKGVILLPTGIEDYGSLEDLVKEIQDHIKRYLDISEDMEIFAVYYILMSWLFDKTNTVNYLRFLGDFGTGKSRALDIIGRLCYKPILINGALTVAPVYRLLDFWKGTLVIDEGDFKKSDEAQDIIKIFNAGFERSRSNVVRCNPNDVSEIDTFNVYGTKVISSRRIWKDKALESRCLTEVMRTTTRKNIVSILDNSYFEDELVLRNKLLKFRMDYWSKIDYEYVDLDIPNIEPRLKQAVSSFSILLKSIPSLYERFKKFVVKYNADLIEERAFSFQGLIIQSLFTLLNDGIYEIGSKEIANKMGELFDTDYKAILIGRGLKSMGFVNKVIRVSNGTKRVISFNEKLLKTLKEKYIPVDSHLRNVNVKNVTDVTDVTDTIGGLDKNYKKIADFGGSGSPVTSVTSVTSVTNKLEKWKKSGSRGNEVHIEALKLGFGLTLEEIKKLKTEGIIFEVTPKYYKINK